MPCVDFLANRQFTTAMAILRGTNRRYILLNNKEKFSKVSQNYGVTLGNTASAALGITSNLSYVL
jgi:hypothetical protein